MMPVANEQRHRQHPQAAASHYPIWIVSHGEPRASGGCVWRAGGSICRAGTRLICDTEVADPGIVRRVLDEKLEQGEEPRKVSRVGSLLRRLEPGYHPSVLPKLDGEFSDKPVGGFDCLCVVSAVEIDARLDVAVRSNLISTCNPNNWSLRDRL
jgi:hypothetical protein